MQTRKRTRGDVVVLSLKGGLTAGSSVLELRREIDEAMGQGHRDVVLDLAGLSGLDAGGLGALVASHTALTSQGGRLTLTRVPERIRHLLRLFKLSAVIECSENNRRHSCDEPARTTHGVTGDLKPTVPAAVS